MTLAAAKPFVSNFATASRIENNYNPTHHLRQLYRGYNFI